MFDSWGGWNDLEQNENNPWEDMNWRADLSTELEGVVTVDLMKAADRHRDRDTQKYEEERMETQKDRKEGECFKPIRCLRACHF